MIDHINTQSAGSIMFADAVEMEFPAEGSNFLQYVPKRQPHKKNMKNCGKSGFKGQMVQGIRSDFFSPERNKKHDVSFPDGVVEMEEDHQGRGFMNSEFKNSFMNNDKNMQYNSPGKILIVDDEKFNCDIIDGFLMILGILNRHEICTFAYNGDQAVRVIQESFDQNDPYRYSLILMDCNMPFLDGYEASKKIRKIFESHDIHKNNQPRIVALTGHVENEYVEKAFKSGMDKVYPKPLPIKDFGQLMIDMKLIVSVPSHLRIETEELNQ